MQFTGRMQRTDIQSRIVFILLIGAVLFSLTTSISDSDLFWHLATGRWIWEHRELPKEDPFSYITFPEMHEQFLRPRIILTQYWLANVIQYGVYALAGYGGIIGLRIIIIPLTLLITYKHLRKKGLSLITSVLLLLPLAGILIAFKGDRPNQMTFLFLAIFLYLIGDLKHRTEQHALNLNLDLILLPLVMLLWANIHGGFILGGVIVVIYVLSELIRIISYKSYRTYRMIFIALITILAGLLNPNGYTVIHSLIKETSNVYFKSISETATPLTYIRIGMHSYLYMIIMFLIPAVLSIVLRLFTGTSSLKHRFLFLLEEILLIIFLGWLSFTGIRYIPLLAVAMTPTIGLLFSGAPDNFIKKLSLFIVPETVVVSVSFWFVYSLYPQTIFNNPVVHEYYPEDTVMFIKQNGIKGNTLSYYDWGGYLIWRFYPDRIVLVDGRGLSQKVYTAYLSVIFGNKASYRAILNAYSVRYILLPSVYHRGGLLPIIPLLVNDPEWRLIFYSKNELLFTRERFEPSYPKSISYRVAIENAYKHITENPDNPVPYLTIAKAYVGLGKTDSAVNSLKHALSRQSLKGGPVEKTLNLLVEGKYILK